MKVGLDVLARIMVQCLQNLAEDGVLEPGDHRFEDVFGFSHQDIAEIHSHKIGVGDGVWFRLHDGRVFSAYAEQSDPDRGLYDTVAN